MPAASAVAAKSAASASAGSAAKGTKRRVFADEGIREAGSPAANKRPAQGAAAASEDSLMDEGIVAESDGSDGGKAYAERATPVRGRTRRGRVAARSVAPLMSRRPRGTRK